MKQLRIRVYGIVQGVGFRPFVSRLAASDGLRGSVCNKGSFVEIFVQGEEPALTQFQRDLETKAPERSVILKIDVTEQPLTDFADFQIIGSKKKPGDIFVSPDIAICSTCKTELFDPGNRRYLHPFINCTACGPRLTILKQMPYDRARTTMAAFEMCPLCGAEYKTRGDRRYDAQPVCCPDCGPHVYLIGEPQVQGVEAIQRTRAIIRAGGIAAVKGIGGFHLCCDAGNEKAVKLLRERKSRPKKPFAVMARDIAAAKRICVITEKQAALLDSPQKPIVICRKRRDAVRKPAGKAGNSNDAVWSDDEKKQADMTYGGFDEITEAVAPGNPTLGIMLPYTPLHLLLFGNPAVEPDGSFPKVLVMTSGNRGGAPICRDDAEAAEQLSELCDIILSNDREILIRADDSVIEASEDEPYMIRRSRGYAPLPTAVSANWSGQVLAVGGELKNCFCIGKDGFFYPSPYVGDLSDLRSLQALCETAGRMLELFEVKPLAVACDLHPDYQTSAYAKTLDSPVIAVQHHFAHVLSCMVEHDAMSERVIGVAFDGTGYGSDGTIWGGEFLVVDIDGFIRAGSIAGFSQPGGDAAVRDGWRIAVALLLTRHKKKEAALLASELGLCDAPTAETLAAILSAGFRCVTSTSVGRLFDAVSALLGICKSSTFEGEAAMALQYAAQRYVENAGAGGFARTPEMGAAAQAKGAGMMPRSGTLTRICPQSEDFFTLDYMPLLWKLISDKRAGKAVEELAYLFHEELAEGVTAGCEAVRSRFGIGTVVLSGGCFVNRLLLTHTKKRLLEAGFRVLTHSRVPANDGGIALGQAVYAMNRLNRRKAGGLCDESAEPGKGGRFTG